MDTIDIITDGACSGNPGRGGWAAIVITDNTHHEYSGTADTTTNNRMEMMAAITGLTHAPTQGAIRVFTDSQYLINGITKWVHTWQRNNWRTRENQPVENQDLWEQLIAVTSARVTWHYVRGHNGHVLNERANTLAQQQAGSVARSSVTHSPAGSTTTGFPCYISYVNGTLSRHATWEACQRAVHGVSHAKFKKVANQQQLDAQLTQWGIR